jgi:lipoic acid synthetase
MTAPMRKPPWLRARLPAGERCGRLKRLLRERGLRTVCEEAACPNAGTCWDQGRATVMILGDACTRRCGFCNVAGRRPGAADPGEPRRVAEAVRDMGMDEIVITSVTRDDLPDGGAAIWARTIRAVRDASPGMTVEVLVPDFGGSAAALDLVLAERPDVFGHNLETVRSLYRRVRPGADYDRSLRILGRAHRGGLITKTSVMLGIGETDGEVRRLMADAVEAGCDIFFAGQYLRPSRRHLPVRRYVDPARFDELAREGRGAGFRVVAAGPLVRSSYFSEEQARYVRGAPADGGRPRRAEERQ